MTLRRLRALTAGESHGPALLGILEGLPAGLPLTAALIDRDLARRQKGYGRGGRMRIEQDAAEILAGVRFGETLGSPLGLLIHNKDWANWTERMSPAPGGPDPRPVQVPRPGHTDLAGALKYGRTADLRDILERASARETAMRVALGAAARALLRDLGIQVGSYVRSIGTADAESAADVAADLFRDDAEALALRADETETRALTAAGSDRLVQAIQEAQRRRDTLGGVVEVVATGAPPASARTCRRTGSSTDGWEARSCPSPRSRRSRSATASRAGAPTEVRPTIPSSSPATGWRAPATTPEGWRAASPTASRCCCER